jgi:hypothetical protein
LILGVLFDIFIPENTVHFYIAYWAINAIASLLSLAIIIAIFWPGIEMIYRRLGLPGFILPMTVLAVIDFSFWHSLHHMFSRDWLGQSAGVVYSFDLGVSLIQVIIFLMSLWLRRKYRKIWGPYNFSIISGFAAISASTLMAYSTRLGLGATFELVFRYIPFLALLGVTLFWIYVFSRPEPEDKSTSKPTDPKDFDDLARDAIDLFDRVERIFRPRPPRYDAA